MVSFKTFFLKILEMFFVVMSTNLHLQSFI